MNGLNPKDYIGYSVSYAQKPAGKHEAPKDDLNSYLSEADVETAPMTTRRQHCS